MVLGCFGLGMSWGLGMFWFVGVLVSVMVSVYFGFGFSLGCFGLGIGFGFGFLFILVLFARFLICGCFMFGDVWALGRVDSGAGFVWGCSGLEGLGMFWFRYVLGFPMFWLKMFWFLDVLVVNVSSSMFGVFWFWCFGYLGFVVGDVWGCFGVGRFLFFGGFGLKVAQF